MSGLVNAGDAVIYMKVGTHATEDLASIIERKREEIDAAGFSMWGYGGGTCHPRSVRPFVEQTVSEGRRILLVMQPMTSRHRRPPISATEFSVDGVTWQPIPAGIDVKSSQFALCLRTLDSVDAELALGDTEVAFGRSVGRIGTDYIKGRVDKACLEVVSTTGTDPRRIEYAAELVKPYAVFVH